MLRTDDDCDNFNLPSVNKLSPTNGSPGSRRPTWPAVEYVNVSESLYCSSWSDQDAYITTFYPLYGSDGVTSSIGCP